LFLHVCKSFRINNWVKKKNPATHSEAGLL